MCRFGRTAQFDCRSRYCGRSCRMLGVTFYHCVYLSRRILTRSNKTRKHASRNMHIFPMFPSFAIRVTLFPASIFVSKMQIMLTLHGRELSRDSEYASNCKMFRARASEHSSTFYEQFQQRPNFASTLKLNGTIRYPLHTSNLQLNRNEVVVSSLER